MKKGSTRLRGEELALLIILMESFERGAASISCGTRMKTAKELEKSGLIEPHGVGYRINKSGMIALIKEVE